MSIVTISSPKGGVGVTTLAANLGYSMASKGIKVLLIDCNVQNSLRLHFGMPFNDKRGYVAQVEQAPDWSENVLSYEDNIFVLPYGITTEPQRLNFENRLRNDKYFLPRGLEVFINDPQWLIVADLPTTPSIAFSAFSEISDISLTLFLADSASLALLPQAENQLYAGQREKQHFVLNQIDLKRKVSQESAQVFQHRLGNQLLGMIHRDESVIEANAAQISIGTYNPASAAAFDIETLGQKLIGILGIHIGDGVVHTAKSVPNQ
ncbi:cellulose synthase operon protein YhjQ [Photobacterium sp. BZF1]|uniref:cellulose biosynthesis protein BcsQ n=1 Tax=Photobacterium sp. BZF1 TaxID=1904457 RepID=UPI0016537811|nr:cellulose biosynthesis protein BcsQ [Photobacterium sp. BZF1]MBC7006251.1 cellulose synthase operon protein YhjQ [Photobacterium sp. BZF1]